MVSLALLFRPSTTPLESLPLSQQILGGGAGSLRIPKSSMRSAAEP
jgi:hypothetical protein